jgi:hypothetical protein
MHQYSQLRTLINCTLIGASVGLEADPTAAHALQLTLQEKQ